MKSYEVPTIMSGKVVHYGEELQNEGAKFPKTPDIKGCYHISASRDAVMIHHAEFNTQIELDQISEALAAAFIRHRQLSVSY